MIASKIEEAPKHVRQIINVFFLLDQLDHGKTFETARPLRLNTPVPYFSLFYLI